jgi:hypothetical protein
VTYGKQQVTTLNAKRNVDAIRERDVAARTEVAKNKTLSALGRLDQARCECSQAKS